MGNLKVLKHKNDTACNKNYESKFLAYLSKSISCMNLPSIPLKQV